MVQRTPGVPTGLLTFRRKQDYAEERDGPDELQQVGESPGHLTVDLDRSTYHSRGESEADTPAEIDEARHIAALLVTSASVRIVAYPRRASGQISAA